MGITCATKGDHGLGFFDAGFGDAGLEELEVLGLDERAVKIHGRVEVHLEGDGAAGDQGEADLVPVAVGGVFDQSPALEDGFVGEVETVGGFPDGGFKEIADADGAGAFAFEVDGDGLALGVSGSGNEGEGFGELFLEAGIEDGDIADGAQGKGAYAGGGDEGDGVVGGFDG